MSDWNEAIEWAATQVDRWDWYSMGMPKEISPEHIGEITGKLAKHIASLKRHADQDGWIPIESIPMHEPVLCFVPGNLSYANPEPDMQYVAYKKRENVIVLQEDDHIIISPTHYRRLPSAPTPEAK